VEAAEAVVVELEMQQELDLETEALPDQVAPWTATMAADQVAQLYKILILMELQAAQVF
jgi:hypothetical protein